MIRDARTLRPEFVPHEVRHRDGGVDAIEAALEPITRVETFPADRRDAALGIYWSAPVPPRSRRQR